MLAARIKLNRETKNFSRYACYLRLMETSLKTSVLLHCVTLRKKRKLRFKNDIHGSSAWRLAIEAMRKTSNKRSKIYQVVIEICLGAKKKRCL